MELETALNEILQKRGYLTMVSYTSHKIREVVTPGYIDNEGTKDFEYKFAVIARTDQNDHLTQQKMLTEITGVPATPNFLNRDVFFYRVTIE